ncbi:DUF4129 domain-containing protein [Dermabacteraceae bacterium TAE3-ERU27]|nr:DUF4129 domain-containing protein [Dermabacteraceae bacterium TAE3-ERU27]
MKTGRGSLLMPLGVFLLGAAAVVSARSARPAPSHTIPGRELRLSPPPPRTVSPEAPPPPPQQPVVDPARAYETQAWLGIVITLAVVAAVICAAWLVLRIVQALRTHRAPLREPVGAEAPSVSAPRELGAVADAFAAAREELDTGPPEGAVCRAWRKLEAVAATGGVPRRSHETADQFTSRALAALPLDAAALRRLESLYQQERYSGRALSPALVADAEKALHHLQESLREGAAQAGGEGA